MIDWGITIAIFLVLQFWISKIDFFREKKLPRYTANLLFATKFAAGIALYLLYTFYYTNRETADIYKFYDDGLTLKQIIHDQPKEGLWLLTGQHENATLALSSKMCNWTRLFTVTMLNENRLLIRTNCLLAYITGGIYQLHNLFFCLLAFLGSWWLVKSLASFLARKHLLLFIFILFFPSTMLWSSGMLKESILLFCVGYIVYFLQNEKSSIPSIIGFVFMLYVMAYTRTFLAVVFSLAAISFILSSTLRSPWIKGGAFLGVYVIVFFIAMLLPKIDPVYDYFRVIAKKQMYAQKEAAFMDAGSLVELPHISKDPRSLLSSVPLGFFYTLVQPSVFQASGNTFVLISGIENTVLILFILYLLFGVSPPKGKRASMFWLLLTTSVIYFSFIGLLVPVLGNLVRYKALVMPLLLGSLLLIQKEEVD
jgi:hypothetical protein